MLAGAACSMHVHLCRCTRAHALPYALRLQKHCRCALPFALLQEGCSRALALKAAALPGRRGAAQDDDQAHARPAHTLATPPCMHGMWPHAGEQLVYCLAHKVSARLVSVPDGFDGAEHAQWVEGWLPFTGTPPGWILGPGRTQAPVRRPAAPAQILLHVSPAHHHLLEHPLTGCSKCSGESCLFV
jgi:hypothetical protein